MRFVKGAEIFTAAGEKVGTVSRIVIDARTKDVTDLVVARGALFKEEKVVPVGLLDLENQDRLMLRETNQNVDDLLDYQTTHYVPVEAPGGPDDHLETAYWYPPLNVQMQVPHPAAHPAASDRVTQTETDSSIPEGRLVISEGAKVVSADDKHIGNVEQVIMNAESNTVTHFVIAKGILLKEHKLVPAFWVTDMDDERLRLSVESSLFERLPDYDPG